MNYLRWTIFALLLFPLLMVGCADCYFLFTPRDGNFPLVRTVPRSSRIEIGKDGPFDLQIKKGGFGRYNEVVLSSSGKGSIKYRDARETTDFQLTQEEMANIRSVIESTSFQKLQKEYHAHGKLADGTQVYVTLTTDGESVEIYCNNHFPDPVLQLLSAVKSAIGNHLP